MEVEPERVGEIAVRGTLKGKMIIIPGVLAGTIAFFIRLLPKRWVAFIYNAMGGKVKQEY